MNTTSPRVATRSPRVGATVVPAAGVLACAALAVLAAPGTARAAEAAAAGALEEIVVTARKREESLQQVPISVSAVTGDYLERNDIGRLDELTASLPNVHVGESGVLDNVFIRGIGSGTNQGFEQSVGTFQDGLYYGRSRNSRGPFLDVARVEVLKGPQGILFGKNTVAGAINLVSKVPGDAFESSVSASYGFEDSEFMATGAVGGPLTETFGVRLAGRVSSLGGYVENRQLGRDEPETEEVATRLTAVWRPGEATTVTARGEFTTFDTNGRGVEISACSAQLRTILSTRGPLEDCTFDLRKTSTSQALSGPMGPENSDSETQTIGLTVEHDFGPVTLTSLTGWVGYDYRDLSQPTSSPLPVLLLDVREDFSQLSQELRLASTGGGAFDWLAGVYWQDADLDARFDTNVNPAGAGFPFPSGTRANDFAQEATTWAAFGQGTLRFGPVSLTGGVRWSREEKDVVKTQAIGALFDRTQTTNPGILGFFRNVLQSNGHRLTGSRSESNVSPSVQLQWEPADGLMAYASFSTGFKGGGFDALLPNGDPRFFEFQEEEATAYEVGFKGEFADGRARLNVAVFHNTFDDLQVSTFDGALSFVVGNAAQAVSQGVEFDAAWAIGGGFRLDLAGAYLDSTYDDFRNASCWFGQTAAQGCVGGVQDLTGAPTQFAPEWSGNLALGWERQVGTLTLRARVEADLTTRYFIPSDNDPNVVQGGFTKYHARVGVAGADDRWEVALIGRNLSDKLTTSWGNDLPLFNGSYFKFADRPRTIAVQGTLRFE